MATDGSDSWIFGSSYISYCPSSLCYEATGGEPRLTTLTLTDSVDPPAREDVALISTLSPPFIAAGSRFELTLAGPACPPYEWFKDGVLLLDAPERIAGSGEDTLVFAPVLEEDAGVYVATYENVAEEALQSEPFLLEVQPKGSVPITGRMGLIVLAVAVTLGGLVLMKRN